MQTQITNLVEQTVLERMRAREPFTALDISNALKQGRYPVRHSEVAAAVRDIFGSGAMGYYDYDRTQIDVVTEGGTKKTQAFLYRHAETRAREYTRRGQDSLPLVPADEARDLADCVAAGSAPVLPRPPRAAGRGYRQSVRRDGALPIPRALVERLGWREGMTLTVTCDHGTMQIAPQPPTLGKPEKTLRVWGNLRLRVCKTKLMQGGFMAEQVTVELDGGGLRVRRT